MMDDSPAVAVQQREEQSASPFRGRGRLLIGAGLFLVGLLYFAYLAFQGSTVYYVTVSELLSKGDSAYGQQMRVNGTLIPGSFLREEKGTGATFALTDPGGGPELVTVYNGVVPDLFFNDHSEIVAEGRYGSDGVFHADNLIVKCPSKYASEAQSS